MSNKRLWAHTLLHNVTDAARANAVIQGVTPVIVYPVQPVVWNVTVISAFSWVARFWWVTAPVAVPDDYLSELLESQMEVTGRTGVSAPVLSASVHVIAHSSTQISFSSGFAPFSTTATSSPVERSHYEALAFFRPASALTAPKLLLILQPTSFVEMV